MSAAAKDFAAVPAELRELPQWVLWRIEQRDNRQTKVPYRVDGAGRASSTDPSTWGSFPEAVAAADALAANGIGFCFSKDDPYVGVDLDAAMPEIDKGAIMAALDSYSEHSVSGAGFHVIVRASLNGHPRNRSGPLEMYEAGRFFVMTGEHVVGTPTVIEARQEKLEEVVARFLPAPAPVERTERPTVAIDLDDQELIDRAMRAKNGTKFERLWNGDTTGYAHTARLTCRFAHCSLFGPAVTPNGSTACFVRAASTAKSGSVRNTAKARSRTLFRAVASPTSYGLRGKSPSSP